MSLMIQIDKRMNCSLEKHNKKQKTFKTTLTKKNVCRFNLIRNRYYFREFFQTLRAQNQKKDEKRLLRCMMQEIIEKRSKTVAKTKKT